MNQVKLQKKYGCPDCYKKTYVTYELGDTCSVCGKVIGVTFWYESKQIVGRWVRCDEETAIRMASNGFKVKKHVRTD